MGYLNLVKEIKHFEMKGKLGNISRLHKDLMKQRMLFKTSTSKINFLSHS